MPVTFDTITNSLETIDYIASANNTTLYADSNAISIFGPIWLPRVYGKDLTAFEIASSGKIAITISDVHAIDMSQTSLAGSNHYVHTLNTKSNYSFEVMTNNRDIQTYYDSINNNLTMYAASNVYIKSGEKNVDITACNDYVLNAKSNVSITAQNANINLFANSCNMTMTMDYTTSNVVTYAGMDWRLTTSNDVVASASSNIHLSAMHGSLKMWANNSNMFTLMDGPSSNITTYAGMDWKTEASNNIILRASSNVLVSALHSSLDLWANDSNIYMRFDALTSNLTSYAGMDWKLTTSNDVIVEASSNVFIETINANYGVYSYSNLKHTAHESNMYIHMLMPSDVMNIFALSNMNVTTCNDFNLNVRSNMNVTNTNYNMWTSHDGYMSLCNDLKMTVCNNYNLDVANDIVVTSTTLDVTTSRDIDISAQSNMNVYIQSSPDLPNEPVFIVSGNNVKVRGDLLITGSINTSNIVNTTVVQENLKIQDKVIVVSSISDVNNSNAQPVDGAATNDLSGLQVDGNPANVNSNLYSMYEKSLLWRYGTNGTLDLGTANMTTESYWELKGGSFRITQKRNYGTSTAPVIGDISFGFRINEFDELELVKKWYHTASSNYVYKRIARFGRILE